MNVRSVVFALAAVFAFTASVARAGDDKCTIATKGDSPSAQACATGGRKAAAKQMKTMVKAAKAKGTKFVCDDCHKNIDDYALTENARKDFEKLLEAAK